MTFNFSDMAFTLVQCKLAHHKTGTTQIYTFPWDVDIASHVDSFCKWLVYCPIPSGFHGYMCWSSVVELLYQIDVYPNENNWRIGRLWHIKRNNQSPMTKFSNGFKDCITRNICDRPKFKKKTNILFVLNRLFAQFFVLCMEMNYVSKRSWKTVFLFFYLFIYFLQRTNCQFDFLNLEKYLLWITFRTLHT